MTVIISIERCLVVTNPRAHLKWGRHLFNSLITFGMLGLPLISLWDAAINYINRGKEFSLISKEKDFREKFQLASYIFLITNGCGQIILFTAAAFSQIYLMYYIRKRYNSMRGSRHTQTNYADRVSKTIAIMFFCICACYLPHSISYILVDVTHNFTRGIQMEILALLIYLNSFINAIILLGRSTKMRNIRAN